MLLLLYWPHHNTLNMMYKYLQRFQYVPPILFISTKIVIYTAQIFHCKFQTVTSIDVLIRYLIFP